MSTPRRVNHGQHVHVGVRTELHRCIGEESDGGPVLLGVVEVEHPRVVLGGELDEPDLEVGVELFAGPHPGAFDVEAVQTPRWEVVAEVGGGKLADHRGVDRDPICA